MEELVAELNAAFLPAVLGPTPSSREEHAALYRGTARVQFWFCPATTSTEKKTGRCHPPAAIRLCRSKATEGPTSRRLP